MTPEQAKEYRTVEIFQIGFAIGTKKECMKALSEMEPKTGYFHMWVDQEFEVEDLFHSGRPQDAGIILKTKVQDCRALIEHEDGTMEYYKPSEFRFTDRK
jgi:hypothetical protein